MFEGINPSKSITLDFSGYLISGCVIGNNKNVVNFETFEVKELNEADIKTKIVENCQNYINNIKGAMFFIKAIYGNKRPYYKFIDIIHFSYDENKPLTLKEIDILDEYLLEVMNEKSY